jgi:hypothetical protein
MIQCPGAHDSCMTPPTLPPRRLTESINNNSVLLILLAPLQRRLSGAVYMGLAGPSQSQPHVSVNDIC